jgi:hypothetical protein
MRNRWAKEPLSQYLLSSDDKLLQRDDAVAGIEHCSIYDCYITIVIEYFLFLDNSYSFIICLLYFVAFIVLVIAVYK